MKKNSRWIFYAGSKNGKNLGVVNARIATDCQRYKTCHERQAGLSSI